MQDGGPCYIVLDDAQRLAQKPLLAPLLRLRELSGGCNIGVILICSMGWEAFMHDTLAEQAPLPVLFRPYKDHDIMQVIATTSATPMQAPHKLLPACRDFCIPENMARIFAIAVFTSMLDHMCVPLSYKNKTP